MAQTKTTLKGYFNTGDIPSQTQYYHLIDSQLNLAETGTQIAAGNISSSGFIKTDSHITASGNISSSGEFIGASAYITNITASSNISASGTITAEQLTTSDDLTVGDKITTKNAEVELAFTANTDAAGGGDFRVKSVNNNFMIFSDANKDKVGIGFSNVSGNDLSSSLHISGNLTVGVGSSDGHITSSGNISASGHISAYGSSSFSGLPTSVPSTTGSLWMSGSNTEGTSKYLMVFTG